MRSRLAPIIAAQLCFAASAQAADPEAEAALSQAIEQFENADFDRALKTLAVAEQKTVDLEMTGRLRRQAGIVLVATARPADALITFVASLRAFEAGASAVPTARPILERLWQCAGYIAKWGPLTSELSIFVHESLPPGDVAQLNQRLAAAIERTSPAWQCPIQPPVAAPAADVATAPEAKPVRMTSSDWPLWGTLGVATVGIGVGVTFRLSASSTRKDIGVATAAGESMVRIAELESDRSTQLAISVVGLGVAGASVVAGAVWLLWFQDEPGADGAAATASVGLAPDLSRPGLVAFGRF